MNIVKIAVRASVMLLVVAGTAGMSWEPASSPSTPSVDARHGYPSVVDMRPLQQAFN